MYEMYNYVQIPVRVDVRGRVGRRPRYPLHLPGYRVLGVGCGPAQERWAAARSECDASIITGGGLRTSPNQYQGDS